MWTLGNCSTSNMHADSPSHSVLLSIFRKDNAYCQVNICGSPASSTCSLHFIPLFRPTEAQFPNNTAIGSAPSPPKSDMDLSPESISRILCRVQSDFSIFPQGLLCFYSPPKKKKSPWSWGGRGSQHFVWRWSHVFNFFAFPAAAFKNGFL